MGIVIDTVDYSTTVCICYSYEEAGNKEKLRVKRESLRATRVEGVRMGRAAQVVTEN